MIVRAVKMSRYLMTDKNIGGAINLRNWVLVLILLTLPLLDVKIVVYFCLFLLVLLQSKVK